MMSIDYITVEADDPSAAESFYSSAFGLDGRLRVRQPYERTSGFRGFAVSLVVAQPANVALLLDSALGAGAVSLKPMKKSMWGHGGVVQAPDGAIWKVATPAKKDSDPATREVEQLVVLIGALDVGASKKFYVEHGLEVGKSFLNKYVQFDLPSSPVQLALYSHRSLAQDVGVRPEGTGSHRLTIGGDIGHLTDPDGFMWEKRPTREHNGA